MSGKVDWGAFDRRYLVTYTGYSPARLAGCGSELRRVGLTGVEVVRGYATPFDEVLARHVPMRGLMMRHVGVLNSVMNHYRAIKSAYETGGRRCLVMEDDIRFLRDVGRLAAIVGGMPDADLALFDWWLRAKADEEEYAAVKAARPLDAGGAWAPFSDMRSAACYSLSRRGMERMIALLEAAARQVPDAKMLVTDQYWPRLAAQDDMFCAFSTTPAAVQWYSDGTSITNMDSIWARYARFNIRKDDYGD